MKLISLFCTFLMLASNLIFILPAQAGKTKVQGPRYDKDGRRIYRPHIKSRPTQTDFMSDSQVSGKLNEKHHQSGVIIIPLEKLVVPAF